MTNHTPNPGAFEPPAPIFTVEDYLHAVHGDLHAVILPMLEDGLSQGEIAANLSTEHYTVTQSWVSRWLRANYRPVVKYVRKEAS